MTKHTPGPWEILPLRGKYYGTDVQIGDSLITVWTPDYYESPFGSEREIAQGWEPADGHDHVEDVRSYANARLIAAAPELLEVAKQLAQAFKRIKDDEWPLLGLCRAAIAKAEGGQDE